MSNITTYKELVRILLANGWEYDPQQVFMKSTKKTERPVQ